MISTQEILKRAKAAVPKLSAFSACDIDKALNLMADALIEDTKIILEENAKDVERARSTISETMIDRLALTEGRILAMAEGIREIAKLPSPLGEVIESKERPNGLLIEKIAVPMGVIAIIYESRPNVTSDAAALAIKSGNVCILRGGKEAYNSSYAIVSAMRRGLTLAGLPKDAVSLIEDTSRESATELMRAKGYVDLLIPRGGKGLIQACVQNAIVPTLETGTGICHVYIDKAAELGMALDIIENAKTSRPSVCNAAEVCLVHEAVAERFLPMLKERLCDKREKNPVRLKLDPKAAKIIEGEIAGDEDFDTEFLDYILAVGVVSSVEEAVEHIRAHSTSHSEAIVTEDAEAKAYFTKNVDSAAVYVNASTRFTDGGEFGLGCEMGISTQKMHARGPLGIKELTTYKYVISGKGQVR